MSKYFPIHYSHGGDVQVPTEYLSLDGYSLSTDDLVQLGRNMYKIKVNISYERAFPVSYS